MPGLTPGRRWQPAYYPFKRETAGRRLMAAVERAVKGPMFGCRMCGNCLLQETAFICPMECPKGSRNGPCGGSTPEHCYVDDSRPCMWYKIYERASLLGREEMLLEVLPPLDWDRVGTETWGAVIAQVRKVGGRRVARGLASRDPARRTIVWDAVFRPVRQPEWWQGDSAYHPPAYGEPVSQFERRLRGGEFVVTAEVSPPMSVSTNLLCKNVELAGDCVTAINFTDNASATPRMSSLACSKLALERGYEPVLQIAARDRTRMGLQSEVIGAAALGVRNILCLSGDSARMGPPPMGRSDVLDIDSVQMLWILRRMRDEGKYLDGREIKYPPQYFLGAAASPYASRPDFQAIREHKKINAGAQFFQTNLVFDLGGFEEWLNALAKRNILDKVFILAGITPLKTLKMAEYMHQSVPGVTIPDEIRRRLAVAGENAEDVGIEIALEIIEGIRSFKEVSGIHIMAVGWEKIVPYLVESAGLNPPRPASPENPPKPQLVPA